MILALLLIPLLASAQEVCVDKPALEVLKEDIENASIWESCERFGIKDRSILNHPQKIPPAILAHYRQTKFSTEDPIADYALTRSSSGNFKDAFNGLLGRKAKEPNQDEILSAKLCAKVLFGLKDEEPLVLGVSELDHYRASPEYKRDKTLLEKILINKSEADKIKVLALFENGELELESAKSPIDPDKLTADFIQVMKEEEIAGVKLTRGESHRWSGKFKKEKKLISTDSLKSIPSRALSTLSGGKTTDYMVTEKEQELRSFILSQQPLSLTPQELFRRSYQLNNGNLYLSLLTIENVLSKEWLHPKRGDLKQTQNMKPFAKVFGSHGDVFGHWYHMFGMIFYGYDKGAANAAVAGKVEAVGSLVLSKFKGEKQENKINMSAGKVGGNLKAYVSSQEKNTKFVLKDSSLEKSEEDNIEQLVKEKVDKILKTKLRARP